MTESSILVVLSGLALFAIGVTLLYEVWWRLSFNLPANPHFAAYVVCIMAAGILIGVSFWMVIATIG